MASTFKVAVAGAVLAKVERQELALDQMMAITPDQLIASDVIANHLIHPGVSLSIYNLLELMLTESDNTATDVLVTAAGGPRAVTAWVRSQGVQGLRVDDGTDGIVRRFYGMPREGSFPAALEAATKSDSTLEERATRPNPAFDDDPRDTATPRAMGKLLDRMFTGKALGAATTRILIGIMERCRTGEGRLPGRMPPGTVVAHKTGTIGGTVNDVGVLTLPEDAGRVVIAVFIKKSDAAVETRERAIAEVGRAIRDYYLYGR
jgi:beta-lactamase class A